MNSVINVLYFIGIILWAIPAYSCIKVTMQNFEEGNITSALTQLFFSICLAVVYIITVITYVRIGLEDLFIILGVIGGLSVL